MNLVLECVLDNLAFGVPASREIHVVMGLLHA